LPRTIPARVRNLALEITDRITNPYDKAKAIERYLRENYPYDLDVPAPPDGADVADYFLFDLQRGYCDYYATAMVVLARLNGLPARFVSGYAPGSYDAPNAQYIVRELNAHSWSEIYFPHIGWIEFEPTAALPEIERVGLDATFPSVQENDAAAIQLLTRFRSGKILYWASPFIGILLLSVIYFTLIERWWYLYRLAPEISIERIYRRVYRVARPLAGTWTHAETAHEFMQKTIRRFEEMKNKPRLAKTYSNIQKDVKLLTDLYTASLFSRYNVQREDIKIALRTWKRLRWRLFITRVAMSLLRRSRSLC
jgi:transglutaminase-like putative cysteine protease